MRQNKYITNLNGTIIEKYVKSKIVKLLDLECYYQKDEFIKFLEFNDIFIVEHCGADYIIKIEDKRFYAPYYSYYRYLYEPKLYYVWYVLFWERKTKTNKRLRGSRRSKSTKGSIHKINKRDGFKCVMCGNNYALTVDHINPISKSGDDTFYNLATLCPICNEEKSDNIIDDFIEKYILPY